MGSVKDLEIFNHPTKEEMGTGRFHFSDRYSVFDWGEMPDLIEYKGQALCTMGAYCFEKLEEKGIQTHYKGLVDKNDKTVKFENLIAPSNMMEVHIVNVIKPESKVENGKLAYNYAAYSKDLKNCLIPLEIIYRNGLPEGSSVFRRLEKGKTTIEDLGLDHHPQPGERFEKPIFDVSTKLEETDRYITWQEAAQIAGLSEKEVSEIKKLLLQVNKIITEMASNAGLVNEDGKIELAFDPNRKLMVVDVVGTLDECRFTLDGFHVSKEVARQFYKKTQWYLDVEEAKKQAEVQGVQEWKKLCKSQPPKLDPKLKKIIGDMYMAAANEMTQSSMFKAPSLSETIKKYQQFSGEKV